MRLTGNSRTRCAPRYRPLGCERLESRELLAGDFLRFIVSDASGDDTPLTAFESSALSVTYRFIPDGQTLESVDILARQGDRTLKLGEHANRSGSRLLVSLDGFNDLTGSWDVFAAARTADGAVTESTPFNVQVLATNSFSGDFRGETFTYTASPGSAAVYSGSGGTDTLSLEVSASSVASFNGADLAAFAPNSLITSQAIYAGTAFDYLRLDDGSEVYLQGIERLEFSDGSITELQTRPNDPRFEEQWNLAIADVPDAWRFTRGSDDVLVVSIDSGIPLNNGTPTFSDLESDRLIFRGNADGGNHGHNSVTIFAGEANNNSGIAGVNWQSPVLVLDVYGGDDGNIGINTAINTALNELDALGATRVVFQGGVQGEFWLNVLNQSILPGIEDISLFAVAAGNGGQDISLTSHPDGLSGGIARLEGVYDNFIAVGALQHNRTFVDGQRNASNVFLAGYSNFGENLTFAAPTDSPSQFPSGSNNIFTGTSAANPNVAGYASLVWSANPSLTAGEVRQVLAETAIDLGAAGRDTTFGHGIPDAGAAVRRAWAIRTNGDLANLDINPFSVAPELPGDFNLDGEVDAADYTVWRNALGDRTVQFATADANGDSIIDTADYEIWRTNYGADFITTPLINATLGNGEFAVDSAADVSTFGGGSDQPTIILSRDRALRGTPSGGQGISVDGWDITRLNYPGGNNALGVDGAFGFATDAGTGPGQTGQAFVNSGVVEVRSERINQPLLAGERLELAYLLGSDNASANPEATVRLIFDQGLPTEFTHTFETATATGLDTPPITHEFELPVAASSVTLAFTLDGAVSGHRALLDQVELQAIRPSTLRGTPAVSLAVAKSAGAGRSLDTELPADNFTATREPVATLSGTQETPAEVAAPVFIEQSFVTRRVEPITAEPILLGQATDEAFLLLFAENQSEELAESPEEIDFSLISDAETDASDESDAFAALVSSLRA